VSRVLSLIFFKNIYANLENNKTKKIKKIEGKDNNLKNKKLL